MTDPSSLDCEFDAALGVVGIMSIIPSNEENLR